MNKRKIKATYRQNELFIALILSAAMYAGLVLLAYRLPLGLM